MERIDLGPPLKGIDFPSRLVHNDIVNVTGAPAWQIVINLVLLNIPEDKFGIRDTMLWKIWRTNKVGMEKRDNRGNQWKWA